MGIVGISWAILEVFFQSMLCSSGHVLHACPFAAWHTMAYGLLSLHVSSCSLLGYCFRAYGTSLSVLGEYSSVSFVCRHTQL